MADTNESRASMLLKRPPHQEESTEDPEAKKQRLDGGPAQADCHECSKKCIMTEMEVCEQCQEKNKNSYFNLCRSCAYSNHFLLLHKNVVTIEQNYIKRELEYTLGKARGDLERNMEEMKIDCPKLVSQNEEALKEISNIANACLSNNFSVAMTKRAINDVRVIHVVMMDKQRDVVKGLL